MTQAVQLHSRSGNPGRPRASETPGTDALPAAVPGLSSPRPLPVSSSTDLPPRSPRRPPSLSAASSSRAAALPRPAGIYVSREQPPPYRACGRSPQGSTQEHDGGHRGNKPRDPLSLRPALALRAAPRRPAPRMRRRRPAARALPRARSVQSRGGRWRLVVGVGWSVSFLTESQNV